MPWQRRNTKFIRVLEAAHLTPMAVNLTAAAMPGLVDERGDVVLQELEGNEQRRTVKRTTRSPADDAVAAPPGTVVRRHHSSSPWVRVSTLAPVARRSHSEFREAADAMAAGERV